MKSPMLRIKCNICGYEWKICMVQEPTKSAFKCKKCGSKSLSFERFYKEARDDRS